MLPSSECCFIVYFEVITQQWVYTLQYSEIYLDVTLTWRNHVKKTVEKMLSLSLSLSLCVYKLNVQNRLAGSKWGSSTYVLNPTYKAFITPVLQCSSEALITATPAILNN
jgi:hypothetical protein